MYKVIQLRPCLVIDINPTERGASINLALLADTFCAAGDLVSFSYNLLSHYFNFASKLMYVDLNTKGSESMEENRRKARTDISEWLQEHPGTDIAVILNTHSDDDGTVEYPIAGSKSQWKVPKDVSN